MTNILIVNVNWLGDVIFSIPVFKALKAKYPQAKIVCLAVPRVREILECCPAVDEIVIYDEKGKHRGFLGKLRIISQLRSRKFDAAFLLHGSWTRAVLIYLAGIPQRIGYDRKNRRRWMTHAINSLNHVHEVHRSDHYSSVVEAMGIEVHDRTCNLQIDPAASAFVEDLLKKEGIAPQQPLVIINPGGNWDLKRWPKESWAELVRRIMKEKNLKVVIAGSVQDMVLAQEIQRLSGTNPVVLAGKTNLKQLMALLRRAQLVISADTGPLHIASGVGTKGIGIFGPTRPEITGPRGKGEVAILQKDVGCNKAPCYYLECPENICMKAVSVDEVIACLSKK